MNQLFVALFQRLLSKGKGSEDSCEVVHLVVVVHCCLTAPHRVGKFLDDKPARNNDTEDGKIGSTSGNDKGGTAAPVPNILNLGTCNYEKHREMNRRATNLSAHPVVVRGI